VTAILETAEAEKSGEIKVPHVAVAVFCELGTWADTSRSESNQLHRRLLGVVRNVTVTV